MRNNDEKRSSVPAAGQRIADQQICRHPLSLRLACGLTEIGLDGHYFRAGLEFYFLALVIDELILDACSR